MNEEIKEDVFYKEKNGKIVEAELTDEAKEKSREAEKLLKDGKLLEY